MKKYVIVEMYYCGEQNSYDEMCLTFDGDATEEYIQEVVDKEFDKFIDDVTMEIYTYLPEAGYDTPEEGYKAVRADIATTCSCEWHYPDEGEFDEEYWAERRD